MPVSQFQLPDLLTLTQGLTSVLRRNGCVKSQVTILGREPNVHASTFPSEIVRCRINDGPELELLCKYGDDQLDDTYGHRGRLAYEDAVYRDVLAPLPITVPLRYGVHTESSSSQTWLILEYLANSMWVSRASESSTMKLAARWIGQFHAINEARLLKASIPLLTRYDETYYRGWVARTATFAGSLHRRFPWLQRLCDRADQWIGLLVAHPLTTIHGEFYPKNVLVHNGTIYPIDWQSAAVACGEIDLAALVERWPAAIIQACEDEYQRVRWPGGPPGDFVRRLDAARLYLQFRWLGDRPDWTKDENCWWRFAHLRAAAERLALI